MTIITKIAIAIGLAALPGAAAAQRGIESAAPYTFQQTLDDDTFLAHAITSYAIALECPYLPGFNMVSRMHRVWESKHGTTDAARRRLLDRFEEVRRGHRILPESLRALACRGGEAFAKQQG